MSDNVQNITSITEFNDTPAGLQEYWMSEINAAKKEVEKWHKQGKKVVEVFLDNRTLTSDSDRNFNLFAANTGILKASLYARIPKPDVARRFMDFDDDVARVASIILQRTLSYELENDPTFDTNARNIIEDRIIAGLGTAWVRYEAEHETTVETTEVYNELTGESEVNEAEQTVINNEETPVDYVYWRDVLWSPARNWSEVRWVARRVYMTKDELSERFGEEVTKHVKLVEAEERDNNIETKNKVFLQAEIYEVWDKTSKNIYWVSPSCKEVLDKKDDPYSLPNFFPCPKPLIANPTTSNFVPLADYALVQDQYAELNQLNNRISRLVEACKVAGVYDKQVEGIASLLQDGRENILIPVDKWAAFAEKGGMAGSIAFLPIQQIADVLLILQKSRDIVKAQIYELTGISDIIRGSTNPYETAQAQQIKSQYASLRLNALQGEVANFFSELVQIKAHLILKFYDAQRILERCGQLNKADAHLVMPALQLLKNSTMLDYRINVSVDALQIPNFDNEKKLRTEAVTAISGFIERAVPAAKAAPELSPLLLSMLKWAVAGYHATKELEGILDVGISQLQSAQQKAMNAPKPPTPEELDQQYKMQKLQADIAEGQQRLQNEAKRDQNEFVIEQEKLRIRLMELEVEKARLTANTQLTAIANQTEAALQNRALDIRTADSTFDNIVKTQENENRKVELHSNMLKLSLDGKVNSNSPSQL